ncbi:MAG TPA: TMEM175 family protein [Vicinamibacterales bacterium]|jgi:uncharacterized membrane protein
MGKGRLEAFSDGVIAIIITIMVLELKVPHGEDLAAIAPLWPKFLSYIVSFIIVGIYWNNHHHMMHSVQRVSGPILWSNLFLLFWLSLLPFTSGWIGENHFAAWPVAVYGVVLFMSAVAYFFLVRAIIAAHGQDSEFARRLGSDWKGKVPLPAYALGIALAFANPWISMAIYAAIGALWFIPDRRFEH